MSTLRQFYETSANFRIVLLVVGVVAFFAVSSLLLLLLGEWMGIEGSGDDYVPFPY